MMIWNIILVILFVAWIIDYRRNKDAIKELPFLILPWIQPIYTYLDYNFLVDILGCGCHNYNQFNFPFNANDFRVFMYFVFAVLVSLISVKVSEKCKTKRNRVIYVITVCIFNLWFAYIFSHGYSFR